MSEQNETHFPSSPNVYAGRTAPAAVSFCSLKVSHFARSLTGNRKEDKMNRREFVKGTLAAASAAALFRFSFATEGGKKMKTAVVYFSWSGNTRFAAETIARKAIAEMGQQGQT